MRSSASQTAKLLTTLPWIKAKDVVGRDERARRKLDDLGRTKQIFTALARAHKSFKGDLQIILLEHADQTAWGDLPNVMPVQNWREDTDYLISATAIS